MAGFASSAGFLKKKFRIICTAVLHESLLTEKRCGNCRGAARFVPLHNVNTRVLFRDRTVEPDLGILGTLLPSSRGHKGAVLCHAAPYSRLRWIVALTTRRRRKTDWTSIPRKRPKRRLQPSRRQVFQQRCCFSGLLQVLTTFITEPQRPP